MGAGRKPGTKETKPRKPGGGRKSAKAREKVAKIPLVPVPLGADDRRRIKDLLGSKGKASVFARAKQYQEFLTRISQGGKLTAAEDTAMKQIEAELLAHVSAEEPTQESVDADAFLRTVWNDGAVDMALRIRAAEIVCRGAEVKKGKKEEKNDKAARAGGGKFAPGRAPIALVK